MRAAMIANVGGTRDFRRRRRRTARNQFRLSRPAKLSRVSSPPTVAARFTPRDTEANARRDRSGATRRIRRLPRTGEWQVDLGGTWINVEDAWQGQLAAAAP